MNEYPMDTLEHARYSLLLAYEMDDPRLEEIRTAILTRWPELNQRTQRQILWDIFREAPPACFETADGFCIQSRRDSVWIRFVFDADRKLSDLEVGDAPK